MHSALQIPCIQHTSTVHTAYKYRAYSIQIACIEKTNTVHTADKYRAYSIQIKVFQHRDPIRGEGALNSPGLSRLSAVGGRGRGRRGGGEFPQEDVNTKQ